MLLHVHVISLDISKGLIQKGPLNIHPEVENTSSTSLRDLADMVLISARTLDKHSGVSQVTDVRR